MTDIFEKAAKAAKDRASLQDSMYKNQYWIKSSTIHMLRSEKDMWTTWKDAVLRRPSMFPI